MRRDRQHFSAWAGPELRARRGLLGRVDELLDDASHPPQLAEEVLGRLGGHGHLDLRERGTKRARIGRVASLGIREPGVALAREAVIQLDQGPPQAGPLPFRLEQPAHEVVVGAHVLDADGQFDARLPEDPPVA